MFLSEVFGPTLLYHYMDVRKAADVFTSDCMLARWTHTIPGIGERLGNSFSRRKDFRWHQDYIVKLTVDAQTLGYSNQIIPLDGEAVFSQSIGTTVLRDRTFNQRNGNVLAEEFVIGDIKRINRTIQNVQIGHYPVRMGSTIEMVEIAEQYCARYNIPLRIDPRMITAIEETKARWAEDDD